MPEAVTKKDLENAFQSQNAVINKNIENAIERLASNFKDRFESLENQMNRRFDSVEGRLESLEDDMTKVKVAVLSTDASMHNLVDELEHNGLAVNRPRIFSV